MTGEFAIVRLSAEAELPAWATHGAFSSVTRTSNELSIVCAAEDVPVDVHARRSYRALRVRGPLDFSLVGIVAGLAGALAASSISIFVVSTFDTDYVFVRAGDLVRAIAALRGAGHTVVSAA